MADLPEADQWEAGIYQLEITDPVLGGAEGIDNLQAKQLANRTLYLKNLLANLLAAESVADHEVKADPHPQYLTADDAPGAASEVVQGIIELASPAEAQALTDAVRAITPATLAAALQGSNRSPTYNGYQKLPGGLIVQWNKNVLKSTTASPLAITFPVTFPNGVLCVCPSLAGQQNPNGTPVSASSQTTTGFDAWTTTGGAGYYVTYIAIGY
ncbi:gp53-like domain-containing protein [Sedimenticola hydrogenitrophicus]|uniref:gp53-like domain-containing protein n=1 Tax=Sedimenticola hydrogenitrophicus TaxID=2967975 RepID=UPI0023AEA0B1|nr:hypothetical protein [Sedimenticola hydrogenitrophicus]